MDIILSLLLYTMSPAQPSPSILPITSYLHGPIQLKAYIHTFYIKIMLIKLSDTLQNHKAPS
jgi:hypothetical protein